jgi:D-3-phosphoglycerate dehydrogenase
VLVANAALSLGMKVIGYDPYITVDNAWNLHHEIKGAKSIEAMMAQADFVTLQIPLMEATKGFINEEKLKMMKKGVKILNFARGELVVDADVRKAIEEEKVALYMTDFPNAELLNRPKVVCVPHLGASTNESEVNCAIMAAQQIRNFFENGNIKNSVNFPAAKMDRSNGARICIASKQSSPVASQIAALLEQAGIKVDNMLNKSRNEVSYTIIDTKDEVVASDVLNKIKSMEGVFNVRSLSAKQ